MKTLYESILDDMDTQLNAADKKGKDYLTVTPGLENLIDFIKEFLKENPEYEIIKLNGKKTSTEPIGIGYEKRTTIYISNPGSPGSDMGSNLDSDVIPKSEKDTIKQIKSKLNNIYKYIKKIGNKEWRIDRDRSGLQDINIYSRHNNNIVFFQIYTNGFDIKNIFRVMIFTSKDPDTEYIVKELSKI